MRIGKLAMACAVASLLQGGTLFAQQFAGPQSSAAGTAPPGTDGQMVGFENTKYYAPAEAASPSDTPPAAPAAAAPAEAAPCESSPCEKSPCESEDECKWEPKHLLDNCTFLTSRDITIGGWIAQGYVMNPQNPGDKFNGPVTWMDRANEYMLNEVWTYIGKAANNDGEGFAYGYRVDTLYGESARLTTSAGLEDRINKSQSFYGLAIPNAYLEGAYNDMKVKAGHFISPVGYYTVGTYNNFFNTIPYTYQWGEPFTHTGALTSWQITDNINWGSGFTRGWDNTGNFNPNLGYIGTLTLNNLFKEGDSLAYVHMYSHEPNGYFQAGGAAGAGPIPPALSAAPQYPGKPAFSGRYFQTVVYSRPLTDKLTWILQSDFGSQQGAADASNGFGTTGGPNTAHWYGVNQYLYYKASDQWSWGLNFEWFRDEEGFRVGGFLPNYSNTTNGGMSNTRGWGSSAVTGQTIGGFAGNFFQTTFGPRWTPHPNVVIRPNARFDWYNGPRGVVSAVNGAFPGGSLPYDNGTRNNQGILMTDMIIVF